MKSITIIALLLITWLISSINFVPLDASAQEDKKKPNIKSSIDKPLKILPDLVPIGSEGFCNIKENRLLVTVKNEGRVLKKDNAPKGIDIKILFFTSKGTKEQLCTVLPSELPIELNSIKTCGVDIPSGCFNSDCDFKIIVDPKNNIKELNESNNTVNGICIG